MEKSLPFPTPKTVWKTGWLGERGGDRDPRVFPVVYVVRVGKPIESEAPVPAGWDHLGDRCSPRHAGETHRRPAWFSLKPV